MVLEGEEMRKEWFYDAVPEARVNRHVLRKALEIVNPQRKLRSERNPSG